jgi:hypothetical protein
LPVSRRTAKKAGHYAILASLTSTCRRHDIDPQLYFTQLLTNLPWHPSAISLHGCPTAGSSSQKENPHTSRTTLHRLPNACGPRNAHDLQNHLCGYSSGGVPTNGASWSRHAFHSGSTIVPDSRVCFTIPRACDGAS